MHGRVILDLQAAAHGSITSHRESCAHIYAGAGGNSGAGGESAVDNAAATHVEAASNEGAGGADVPHHIQGRLRVGIVDPHLSIREYGQSSTGNERCIHTERAGAAER